MRHHKTRHDFARVLIEAGIPIEAVAKTLGHKSTDEVFPEAERRFIGCFEAFWEALGAMLAEISKDSSMRELEIRHKDTDFAPDCDPFYVFAYYLGERLEYLFIQQSGKTVEEMRRVES
jgi:hypothetical protein